MVSTFTLRRTVVQLLIGTTLLGGLSLAAQAATLADVRLVERNSGRVLPVYLHQGEYWVAGRPGANYSIDITNRTGRRIMAVISVDGVNAITGKSASATADDGYVFSPWQNWAITGWRKSDSQVAAFYFSESDASYASRTGRPRDVGVIGVALFRERMPEPVRPAPPISRRSPIQEESEKSGRYDGPAADARASTAPASPAPNASPAPSAQPPVVAAESAKPRAEEKSADFAAKRRPSPSPSLGTGHGSIETSYTSNTEFDAATRRPEQVVRFRYDSYANLVAKGVIPTPRGERTPNPFPAQGDNGFVPDPPRW
ncbi:hypothetical protein G7047_02275 [Diaphorobacter sp. HDW4A]|uniref:hypothetical protein n=1 Tax=Diaphorobacter sp. HDW4A TaxID=2714924 RepID=UPI0014095E52|nr:hypothetical protein [Diaphorobacter sp. HDW4A]QIL78883.1 hypothetical protein G7047_02275 [Diaphorobacter sp. HDW4A]